MNMTAAKQLVCLLENVCQWLTPIIPTLLAQAGSSLTPKSSIAPIFPAAPFRDASASAGNNAW